MALQLRVKPIWPIHPVNTVRGRFNFLRMVAFRATKPYNLIAQGRILVAQNICKQMK